MSSPSLQTAQLLVERVSALMPLVRQRHHLELRSQHLRARGQALPDAVREAAQELHADSWSLAARCAEESEAALLRPLLDEPPQPVPLTSAEDLQDLLAELRSLHDSVGAIWMVDGASLQRLQTLQAQVEAVRAEATPATAPSSDGQPTEAAPPPPAAGEGTDPSQPPDLRVELGLSLLPLANAEATHNLPASIQRIRETTEEEWGVRVGPIHIRDKLTVEGEVYVVQLRGEEVARDRLHPDLLLAICVTGERDPSLRGLACIEPSFGLPACWIRESQRPQAEALGYPTVSPLVALATHLQELLHQNLPALFGYSQLSHCLTPLLEGTPLLQDALTQSGLQLSTLLQVFRSLLEERLPVSDAEAILETCIAQAGQPPAQMVEACRSRLGATVLRRARCEDHALQVMRLAPELEDRLQPAPGDWGPRALALSADDSAAWLAAVDARCASWPHETGQLPALLVSTPELRSLLARSLRKTGRPLTVLSRAELPPTAPVEPVGEPIALPV